MDAAARGRVQRPEGAQRPDGAQLLVAFILVGAAVSLALGVYGRVHTPTGRALITLGFGSLIEMKVVLTTAAAALGIVQVGTALRMYGRIGRGRPSRAVARTHRISGVTAVVLTLPVAFQCLWALGFGTYSTRVLLHSLLGCVFYGVFVTKMLVLRSERVPAWALPWLGGTLFTVLVGVWLTSAGWALTSGAVGY